MLLCYMSNNNNYIDVVVYLSRHIQWWCSIEQDFMHSKHLLFGYDDGNHFPFCVRWRKLHPITFFLIFYQIFHIHTVAQSSDLIIERRAILNNFDQNKIFLVKLKRWQVYYILQYNLRLEIYQLINSQLNNRTFWVYLRLLQSYELYMPL